MRDSQSRSCIMNINITAVLLVLASEKFDIYISSSSYSSMWKLYEPTEVSLLLLFQPLQKGMTKGVTLQYQVWLHFLLPEV